ncbi:MAG: hypothetical protein PHY44_06170 [Lachnospiraceae bacterium]|nr:hypothetical protein [Lachnospiraceae bacterium]
MGATLFVINMCLSIALIVIPLVLKFLFLVLKILIKTGTIFPFFVWFLLSSDTPHLLLYKILSWIAAVGVLALNIYLWHNKRMNERI